MTSGMRTLFRRHAFAVSIMAACSAAPAAGEVRLAPTEAGGNYRVTVMSWWEIPFRSVVRQQYDFSCGSAALATLLTYQYAKPTPEKATFAQMWATGDQAKIRESGFSMLDMKNYLLAAGYRAEAFRLNVDQLSQLSQPGIVLLDLQGYKHFVVLKGVQGKRILVGDPVLGLTEYPVADFARMWNGVLLTIVDHTDQAKFNLASDWRPWSTAPLENGAPRVPVSRVTDQLPMDYQITSEYLLDIGQLAATP